MSHFNPHKNELDSFEKFRAYIEEYNETNGILDQNVVEMSPSQQKAIDIFKRGDNLLIIGEGGTGKSWTIRELKYQTQKAGHKVIAISATTGIAAWNINGVTIQSFMGIGTGDADISHILKRIDKKMHVRRRIRDTDIIVIDEVSMASASLFEKINAVCQHVRKSSKPFGGIQIVLTGDLLQLCPVFDNFAMDTRLVFESALFQSMFNIKLGNIVVLESNFRQNDHVFRAF
jgi:ATP-dependent DNA helicase PIF1